MNPSDLSKHGKKKLDVMDLAKKPRKMDKLDKISGLGAANRKMLKEQMKGFQKIMKASKNIQEMNAEDENIFELDAEDFALDPKIVGKLKLDGDFFEGIDDDFEDSL